MTLSLAVQPASANTGDKVLEQFVQARLSEAAGEPDLAAESYREALKLQPDNVVLARRAYRQAVLSDDLALATDAVRKIEQYGTLAPEMPLLLFADAVKSRDYKTANSAIRQVGKLNNFAFLVPLLDAWLRVAQKKTVPVNIVGKGKQESLTRLYSAEQQVLFALAGKDQQRALELMEPIVAGNNARTSPLRVRVAQYLAANGNGDAARTILRRKRAGPEKIQFERFGKERSRRHKAMKAKDGLSVLFETVSRDLWTQKANFYALLFSQLAIDFQPNNDIAHISKARALLVNDRSVKAISALAKVKPESPYHLAALGMKTNLLVQNKRGEEALGEIQAVLKKSPNSFELQLFAAQAYRGLERYDDAIETYKRITTISDANEVSKTRRASYWLALASLQDERELSTDAIASLRKANSLAPNNATILNYLGYAQLERRRNLEEATALIEKAYSLRPKSAAITDSLGWTYFVTGNYTKAVKLLEGAVEGAPSDPTINEHLGDAYWKAGRRFEARYAWNTASLFVSGDAKKRIVEKSKSGLRPELIAP